MVCVRSKVAFIVALVVIGTLGGVTIWSQCRGDSNSAGANKGYVLSDGIRRLTYRIPDGFGDYIRARIQSAVDQWNAHANTTKIAFEPFGQNPDSGQTEADLRFVNAGYMTACGNYQPGPNIINLEEDLFNAPESLANQVVRVIAHELGHALDLGESDISDSIMKVPPYTDCHHTLMQLYFPPTTEVTGGDATRARGCLDAIIQRYEPFSGGGQHEDEVLYTGGNCWEVERVYFGFMYMGLDEYEQPVYALVDVYRYVIDEGCGYPYLD